jgi:hypothetical protein
MTNPQRPDDPFAKLSELQTDQQLFISSSTPKVTPKATSEVTPRVARKATRTLDPSRENSRNDSSSMSREVPRELPSRDEIQEFSFQLRDELKVKVQAEVPHEWQDELEGMARKLDVKKLELYRFIIGEFLGKVQRRNGT